MLNALVCSSDAQTNAVTAYLIWKWEWMMKMVRNARKAFFYMYLLLVQKRASLDTLGLLSGAIV